MSSILAPLWTIYRSYQPGAATRDQRQKRQETLRFGAFQATYSTRNAGWGVRQPRNDREAQELYNHIRTVAFWLDAAPVLSDLGLPFRAGLDDIISLVPIYGDILSGVLQLYQVWLCFIFGVPTAILGYMLLNVILDTVVGLVPILGDFLDNLFKSNLRNLALLETWLLDENNSSIQAKRYHILLMPETTDFIPHPSKPRTGRGWFGLGGGKSAEEVLEREEERRTGRVKRTRRMGRDEGVPLAAGSAGGAASESGYGAGGGAGTQRGGRDPVMDPLD